MAAFEIEAPAEMFFFPFVGGGHQIPMIDMARLFASHGASATIIATPSTALALRGSLDRDRSSGLNISVHALDSGEDSPESDMSAPPSTDTSMLMEPLRRLLLLRRPDCIVADVFHRWSADVIDSTGVTRIVFNGNGCFARCVGEMVRLHKPELREDPFLVPGIPDRVELTRSQLPFFFRRTTTGNKPAPDKRGQAEETSFGVVVNSFRELEPAYADRVKNGSGKKAWIVGPVSVSNRNVSDKAGRGKQSSVDEHSCLSWLDSKPVDSVLYISFGSLLRLAPEQLLEIAHGLEASGHPFVWVVGKVFKSDQTIQDDWVPVGFEDRIKKSGKGLIIRGWAPQLLILEHPAVGGFMTHCGWNSTLEGVNAGTPMITFPLSAEQFYNEKLITDVLKIGVQAGSKNWTSYNMENGATVGREKVEEAVKTLMGDSNEAAEMRRRASNLAEKAKKAVEEGGSSYSDAEALIQELKARRKAKA